MTMKQEAVFKAAMRWYKAVGVIGGRTGAPYFDRNGRATDPLHKLHRACAAEKKAK